MSKATNPTDTDDPDEQSEDHSFEGGFNFGGVVDVDVHFEKTRTVNYTDEIHLTESGSPVKRGDSEGWIVDQETHWTSPQVDKTFDSQEEVEKFLEDRARSKSVPPINPPELPTWVYSNEEIFETVEGEADGSYSLMKVESGQDYLIATARETYTPPADYGFENWGPLTDGRMQTRNGAQQFRPNKLQKAMAYLTDQALTYNPEEFTVYYRGESPLYLCGRQRGVIVAPVIGRD